MSRWRFETRTGAAWARFVVKIAAIDAKVSTARTARSNAPGVALIPECTAADRKPAGAVMPPSIGAIDGCRADAITSGMQRRQRNACVTRPLQRTDDRVLSAAPELSACMAVDDDLLRQPGVWHEREAEVDEVTRRMRERAKLLETRSRRAPHELSDDSLPEAAAARFTRDDHRPYFRDGPAEGSQLGACEHLVI